MAEDKITKQSEDVVGSTSLLGRVDALEKRLDVINKPRILEEMIDRACANGLPIGLSDFSDFVRSLYPEYYSSPND